MPDSPPLPLPKEIALVLQGGGALGSYQAGVYEALCARSIPITWVAGISIGAVNAALIAGNPPEKRLDALHAFWGKITSGLPDFPIPQNDGALESAHYMAAMGIAALGAPGFFHPNMIPAMFAPEGTKAAISLYNTHPLKQTLNDLVDWDLLNDGPMRVAIGVVNVESGNFHYFDTRDPKRPARIDVRHIMASGALPPGFAPVEINGKHYWDGGLVSNTPLAHVMERQSADMLIFQIDLFPAKGEVPRKFADVMSREKDIRFSSRTRAVTDRYMALREEHAALKRVLEMLPPEARQNEDVEKLYKILDEYAVNIVHLIYKVQKWESGMRDFEFSRSTMRSHWEQGVDAVEAVMRKGDILAQNIASGKTAAFDLGD